MGTVLITGVTGFLGSALARELCKTHRIIGLKRHASDLFRIADIAHNIKLYDADRVLLETLFQEFSIDFVIHTATDYGTHGAVTEVLDANVRYPLSLLSLSILSGVKAFINTDTFYTPNYGALQDYSLSKRQFLEWAKQLSDGMPVINLKIGVLFGPMDRRDKFTPSMIRRLLANEAGIDLTPGDQKRNFLYVEEAARIYRLILERINNIPLGFNEFNIGSSETHAVRDYIERLHRLTQSRSCLKFGALPYRVNEIMAPDADISQLQRLGWTPKVTLEEALIRTIDYEKKRT
jgi:nucleoside-diphosphate-sugar epimerase